MSQGPPQPEDSGGDHIALPTPKNGDGTYGVYSRKKKRFIHGQTGMSKGEAKKLAKGWNKGGKKNR